MIIKVSGATVDFQVNSIDIDNAIGARSTASFSILDKDGNMSYSKGQQVQIYEEDGTTIVFGGVIDKPISKYLSLASNAKIHSIQCVDYLYITDKRLIAKVYTNLSAGYIVNDILTKYLAAEGITAGTIQDGPTVSEAVFNYSTITTAIEKIAELAGFEFDIDANKQLNFFHRGTNYNYNVITETSAIKNVQVEPVAEDYRNKQYIKGGMATTDLQTENKIGDGNAKSFVVSFPLAKAPTITVAGIGKAVGIRGIDSGKDWYWNKNENVISQDDNGTLLTNTQTLSITYQGLYNIIAISYDKAELLKMQALDSTTGIVESIVDDPYATNKQAAFDSAAAKLKRYARVGRRITFDTLLTGYAAGQLIHVSFPSYNIDDYYLIESCKAVELGANDGRMVYSLSVVDGSATGGWANFFKKLVNNTSLVVRENIQENEILQTLQTFNKTWLQTDNSNIFIDVLPSVSLYPSATLYPEFEDNNRVKYITFYDSSNTEIFRKQITKQTFDAVNNVLTSTTFIAPFEMANTSDTFAFLYPSATLYPSDSLFLAFNEVAYIGWVGGWKATSSVGSGEIVDKQSYSYTKTNLESIQIDKTDSKGW